MMCIKVRQNPVKGGFVFVVFQSQNTGGTRGLKCHFALPGMLNQRQGRRAGYSTVSLQGSSAALAQ